jgi:hypothetical protein
MVEENVLSKGDGVIANSLKIFMAHGKDKVQEELDKPGAWQGDVWDILDNHNSLPMILRKGEWNELTEHPKDHGKTHPNLRTNFLQQGENDVGWKLPPTNVNDEDVNLMANSLQPEEDDVR